MTTLTEFLFPAPAERTIPGILAWWERRRRPYNLAVGSAGLVTLAFGVGQAWLPWGLPFALGGVVLPAAAFGLMANVCYLLGPVAEIAIDRLWGRTVLPIGPTLYRIGLTFSIGLALFPILIMMIGWVARIVAGVVGLAAAAGLVG